MKEVVMKYVVQNIARYGKANEKAIMGKVMAEKPELRERAKEVIQTVKECIDDFEKLDPAQKKELFEKYKEEREKKKVEDKTLSPLKNAEKGKVTMRFAPNPNGAATLGSARGIVVNSEYVKNYDGSFILRFDDTDPRTKRPLLEAYDWFLEDCEWLNAKPDKVLYASKRIPVYYDYMDKLLEMGHAYPCFCSQQDFSHYKRQGEDCPHRNVAVEDALDMWHKMLEGDYHEGEVVIRIKTDMNHRDPAIRDWVAFRIIYEDHPLVGDNYHVYPMLDFESAIEDHLNGVTHIIRGKDLIDSERRQEYVYHYLGWDYPQTKHWGRIKIQDFGKLSTSEIFKEIEAGRYGGWDDPKLPTVKALRRRGFDPQALRKFFIAQGVDENDVSVSMKNLYAENRKVVDFDANRYFFVWQPVEVKIEGMEVKEPTEITEVSLPLNPQKQDTGYRKLSGSSKVFLSRSDMDRFEEGEVVRLKDFCNIRIEDKEEGLAQFVTSGLEEVKKGKNIIHWLPEEDAIPCVVYGVERDYSGYAEKNALNDLGKVVQFERFSFCRLESFDKALRAIYAHP